MRMPWTSSSLFAAWSAAPSSQASTSRSSYSMPSLVAARPVHSAYFRAAGSLFATGLRQVMICCAGGKIARVVETLETPVRAEEAHEPRPHAGHELDVAPDLLAHALGDDARVHLGHAHGSKGFLLRSICGWWLAQSLSTFFVAARGSSSPADFNSATTIATRRCNRNSRRGFAIGLVGWALRWAARATCSCGGGSASRARARDGGAAVGHSHEPDRLGGDKGGPGFARKARRRSRREDARKGHSRVQKNAQGRRV